MNLSFNGIVARGAGASWQRAVAVLAAAALLLLAAVQPARAAFGITSFSSTVENAGATEESQAGIHPYGLTVSFMLNQTTDLGFPVPDENTKSTTVDLPPGFVGDPTATPTCTSTELTPTQVRCPIDSQVGTVVVFYAVGGQPLSTQAYPVFNMEPNPGQIARFAFNPQGGTPVNIVASLRSDSDYGVTARLVDVPEALPFIGARLTLWGEPSDPSHDSERGTSWICFDDPQVNPGFCFGGGSPGSASQKPFLRNPTYCGSPLTTTIAMDAWQGGSDSASSTTASGMTGCDKLTFEPSISVKPDSTQVEAPTGLTVDVDVPQSRAGLVTPSLRDAVVTLPEGVVLNPPEADGLTGCTDAQVGLHSTAPVACPGSSKIGDITIDTPLLAEQLTGSIYLGQPVPGKKFRIFLVAGSAERGVLDPTGGRPLARSADRAGDDHVQRQPAAAVQQPPPALQGRAARAVGDAPDVRNEDGDGRADAVGGSERGSGRGVGQLRRSRSTATGRRARRPGSRPGSMRGSPIPSAGRTRRSR